MTATPPTHPPSAHPLREVRALGMATAAADDVAVSRIVAFLDGLVDRGELNRILDPVRPRLRGLDTVRRLRFSRLLFLPLDGAIVLPADWTRGEGRMPRNVLRLLADTVQRAMGAAGDATAMATQAFTTHSTDEITRLGAAVWPAAAALLPEQAPPGWADCGISARDYPGIAGVCRAVWAVGPVVWAAVADAEHGPPEPLVQAALEAILPAGPEALAAVLATLLLRAAAPGRVAQMATALHPQMQKIALQALDAVMAEPPPPFDKLNPQRAAEAAVALADRLEDLARCPLVTGVRQRRLLACRQLAEAAFRASYMVTLQQHMLLPVERLRGAEVVQDAEVTAMETAARQLRAMELAGRRLGGALHYEQNTQSLAVRMATIAAGESRPGGLRPVDMARCIEILAGSDAATAVLKQ
ncbi:MAG: hypothetical protein JWP04_3962 [Belnapia sp.]|nr:hypothetical protein [Belnapia sp.]